MSRRRLLVGVSSLLAAPFTAAEAQPREKNYRIGILGNVPLTDPGSDRLWGEFARGLRDLGYVDGANTTIIYLSSDGDYEKLPALAADLVRRNVDIIAAPAAQNVVAAKQATQTTPIVMASVGDPVGNGLVASLARPGGNVTGTSFVTSLLIGKQLELLKQIVPHATRLAILVNPSNPGHPLTVEEAKVAGQALAVQIRPVPARAPEDLDKAFAAMARDRTGAVFVPWDGMFLVHLTRIVALAARARVPALYGQRRYVDVGGLACYGPSAPESFRRAAAYVDKILRGAKPGDLPIEQPTKFEFVINLRTAKALALTIPPRLLERADEVLQ